MCLMFFLHSVAHRPRFEIGGGFWPSVLKWIIRIMYLSQFFMLSVFVLRRFYYGKISFEMCSEINCLMFSFVVFSTFPGIWGAFVMLFITRRFQLYMAEKERDLLKLPLEVAIHLDKPSDISSSTTRAVFLAHVSQIQYFCCEMTRTLNHPQQLHLFTSSLREPRRRTTCSPPSWLSVPYFPERSPKSKRKDCGRPTLFMVVSAGGRWR